MKLKDAARLSMLIEAEGCIQVHRPYQRKGENCLSSPHISISISNTDLAILNWAKGVVEKELGHLFKLYSVSNPNGLRTRYSYQLIVSKFDDVHRILNIVRGLMLGVKKQIADRICSFLDYRRSIVGSNGYVNNENYAKTFDVLIKNVEKVKQTYDQILSVTTLHSPDPIDQKIKSELPSDGERLAEMSNPPKGSNNMQYICEVGLEFHNEAKHAELTGVTS